VDLGFELEAPAVAFGHVFLVEPVEVLDVQMLGNWQELV
jgi:hypothetical protein